MKRKDIEEDFRDDFSYASLSSPVRKSRRLDGEYLQSMQVEQVSEVPWLLEQTIPQEDHPVSTAILPKDDLVVNLMPIRKPVDERALVVYNPGNMSFVKSPITPEISIILNSELVPGLKEYFLLQGDSIIAKAQAAATNKSNNENDSDHCMAVVPSVPSRASQLPSATGIEEPLQGLSDLMEADGEVELMETEGSNPSNTKPVEVGGLVRRDGGLQPWQQQQQQQQCVMPQFFPSTYMPVTW